MIYKYNTTIFTIIDDLHRSFFVFRLTGLKIFTYSFWHFKNWFLVFLIDAVNKLILLSKQFN